MNRFLRLEFDRNKCLDLLVATVHEDVLVHLVVYDSDLFPVYDVIDPTGPIVPVPVPQAQFVVVGEVLLAHRMKAGQRDRLRNKWYACTFFQCQIKEINKRITDIFN